MFDQNFKYVKQLIESDQEYTFLSGLPLHVVKKWNKAGVCNFQNWSLGFLKYNVHTNQFIVRADDNWIQIIRDEN